MAAFGQHPPQAGERAVRVEQCFRSSQILLTLGCLGELFEGATQGAGSAQIGIHPGYRDDTACPGFQPVRLERMVGLLGGPIGCLPAVDIGWRFGVEPVEQAQCTVAELAGRCIAGRRPAGFGHCFSGLGGQFGGRFVIARQAQEFGQAPGAVREPCWSG